MVSDRGAVLVCVTGQRDCDRLIKAGKRIAEERSIPLHVLCVQPTSAGFDADCEELEYLRPVSYTHLDVYKRQLYDLDGTPHVRVDEYMKHRLQAKLVQAIVNKK